MLVCCSGLKHSAPPYGVSLWPGYFLFGTFLTAPTDTIITAKIVIAPIAVQVPDPVALEMGWMMDWSPPTTDAGEDGVADFMGVKLTIDGETAVPLTAPLDMLSVGAAWRFPSVSVI